MASERGKTWVVATDFIETVAFAVLSGALASVALAAVALALSLGAP